MAVAILHIFLKSTTQKTTTNGGIKHEENYFYFTCMHVEKFV